MFRTALPTITAVLFSTLSQASINFAPLEELPRNGVLVLPLAADMALPEQLAPEAAEAINKAALAANFEADDGNKLHLYATGGYDQVLLLGLGDETPLTTDLEELGGHIATATADMDDDIRILWHPTSAVENPSSHLALGIKLGNYRFDKYQTPSDDDPKADNSYTLHSNNHNAAMERWNGHDSAVAEGVIFARDLISEPANTIYPESFVERTRAAFKGIRNSKVKVLDVDDMERLNMGALLGVGMGSERPPRLLVVEYMGGEDDSQPLVFAGKGVTFDTGGISLKPGSGMWKMKYDMSGAAAVTGTVLALAKRNAPVNAVSVAALVENMPSERAQRPGDVRATGSGKTIEVINTDAEGRLILADAVWYAQENYTPALLVDVATLTGSVRTALGAAYGGLFTRHDGLAKTFVHAGQGSGEELWRLPLHEDYKDAIKSDIADIKNTGASGTGAGASVGAEVIGTFVDEETPWVHLDIAGMAWAAKAQPMVPKGAVGWGVRLLNRVVADQYE